MDTQPIPQTVLSDSAALQYFLNDVADLSKNVSSTMYVNLEGIRLSRHGSISIISLYVPSLGKVYHIDAVALGDAVVSTEAASGISLKTIFESPTVRKVFFDVRNDSDALFAQYKISLCGVVDIQLMELASRTYSRRYLASLAKCIDGDSAVSPATKEHWRSTGQSFSLLLRREQGAGRHILNIRPINPLVIEFCKERVVLLPALWRGYSNKVRPPGETFWRCQIRTETDERVKLAKSARYDGESETKTEGPSSWHPEPLADATDAFNESVMFDDRHNEDSGMTAYGSVVLFGKGELDALPDCIRGS